jgi:translation elongation factor EF-1alpha
MAEEKPIGKVIHYYDNISVAIVKLEKKLSVGKTVKFVKGDKVFEQTVESMEIKHGKLTEAKPGDEVGIKVDKTAKEGTLMYAV